MVLGRKLVRVSVVLGWAVQPDKIEGGWRTLARQCGQHTGTPGGTEECVRP